jgi:hypothetical protein
MTPHNRSLAIFTIRHMYSVANFGSPIPRSSEGSYTVSKAVSKCHAVYGPKHRASGNALCSRALYIQPRAFSLRQGYWQRYLAGHASASWRGTAANFASLRNHCIILWWNINDAT